jgi:hypothetical protein
MIPVYRYKIKKKQVLSHINNSKEELEVFSLPCDDVPAEPSAFPCIL